MPENVSTVYPNFYCSIVNLAHSHATLHRLGCIIKLEDKKFYI